MLLYSSGFHCVQSVEGITRQQFFYVAAVHIAFSPMRTCLLHLSLPLATSESPALPWSSQFPKGSPNLLAISDWE